MEPKFEIYDAKLHHVSQMLQILRHEHARIIAAHGLDPQATLTQMFERSSYKKAWFMDGKLAGMGGVTGSLLDDRGFVWIAVAEEALKYPIAFAKVVKEHLDIVLRTRKLVATATFKEDLAAQRLLRFLGFIKVDVTEKFYIYSIDLNRE